MTLCPHCGREYFCLNIDCPHCGKRIVNFFTINAFFRENFHYFTIIGVIGTMIALLPTIGEKFIGTDWISNDLSLLSASLAFLFIFGDLLLLGIFLILLKKIWSKCSRNEEDPLYAPAILKRIKKGDKSRLMLSFCLVPMMLALIGFLLLILFYTPNLVVKSVTLLIVILIILIGYSYYIVNILITFYNIFRRNWKHGILLAAIILILLLFFAYLPSLQSQPQYQIPKNVEIVTDTLYYHPQISSNTGLKLTATNTQASIYGYNWMRWKTNYGYFVTLVSPNLKIVLLGNETSQKSSNPFGNQEIFWLYPESDIGKEKPPVKITLEIFNKSNQEMLTNSTLDLNWKDRDIVVSPIKENIG